MVILELKVGMRPNSSSQKETCAKVAVVQSPSAVATVVAVPPVFPRSDPEELHFPFISLVVGPAISVAVGNPIVRLSSRGDEVAAP